MSCSVSACCHSLRRLSSFVRRRRSASITKWVARIFQERFDLESPNSTRTSMTAKYTTTRDMTSPAASGRHLSKIEKKRPNGAFDGFGSNFSGAAFWLAQSIGGLLVWVMTKLTAICVSEADSISIPNLISNYTLHRQVSFCARNFQNPCKKIPQTVGQTEGLKPPMRPPIFKPTSMIRATGRSTLRDMQATLP